jgi:hypothetical protein
VFPLVRKHGGTEMRIVAFITDAASVTRILQHIGEPTKAPVLSPARGPPAWEKTFDQTPVFDPTAAAPAPAFEFDQTVTW